MADSDSFGFTASASSSPAISLKKSRKINRNHPSLQQRRYFKVVTATGRTNGFSVPKVTTPFDASKNNSTFAAAFFTSLSMETPLVTTADQTSKIPEVSMPNENFGGNTNLKEHFNNGDRKNPTEVVNVVNEEKDDTKHEPFRGPNPMLSIIPISRILKGIPQYPHFNQLRSFSDMVRRNLISGWDKTFEDTVEEIHGIRKEDFWKRASELWKTIDGLESMGYNVVVLRRRIVEMSDVMLELKQRKLEIKALKEKAEMHRMEKIRLESLISNILAKANAEQVHMEEMIFQADDLQQGLPRFDGVFTTLASEPFCVSTFSVFN